MKLAVVSHKPCWRSINSASGFATDGGFPFQMKAISELFDSTTLLVPERSTPTENTGTELTGNNLGICPLSHPMGRGIARKLLFPFWLFGNLHILLRECRRADAIHAPIPGDIGTIGMLLAVLLRKPLFVRHCGNWQNRRTTAEKFWKWFMERYAGDRNVMLATGGGPNPPSLNNPNIKWIFSTSLTVNGLSKCRQEKSTTRPSGQPRLIITSRQEHGKGTDIVIHSLDKLEKRFPGLTLDVAGNGMALEEFKQLAHRLGVSGMTTFHGGVDHKEVLRLLGQADLFCFPSSSEGFPKAVLEALACGLPVVSTRVSVLPELISGAGLIMERTDVDSFIRAVSDILDTPRKYEKMSRTARIVAGKYTLERWQREIDLLLDKQWGRSGYKLKSPTHLQYSDNQ